MHYQRSLFWDTARPPFILLFTTTLVVLLIAWGASAEQSFTVLIGGDDERFIDRATDRDVSRGFLAREDFDGTPMRWTTSDVMMTIPRSNDWSSTRISLRLINGRPSDQPDPQVTLSADGQQLSAFSVPQASAGVRIYHVLAPADPRVDWATRLHLTSDVIVLPEDPRPLGVVVDWVRLTPFSESQPSLWLLICAIVLALSGFALLRLLGAAAWLAPALPLLLAGLISYGIATRPLEFLPFVQRFVALLILGLLGILLARLITADRQAGWNQALNTVNTRVRGSDLPIYLAIAWWMGPLFQFVMTADGVANVTPSPSTLWIGAAMLLAFALLFAWWFYRRADPAADRHMRHVALAIFSLAALAHLGAMLQFSFTRSAPDFWILFRGARDWARGGSLYNLADVATNHFGHVFKVPPFYGMLFLPFVQSEGLNVLFFQRVLNVLLLAGTVAVWLRMWGIRLLSTLGAGTLILLNYRPLADTIAFGQIDLALLFILTLALWALREKRDLAAGVLVALGTLFKIYPVLLLAFFVARWRWRGVLGFVLGMLLFNGAAIAVIGLEMHRVYLFEVVPQIGGTTAWVENQTIAGFLARLSATPRIAEIFQDHTIVLLANLLAVTCMLLVGLLALRSSESKSTTFALQYGQFLLLMVLVVPAAWMHYQTLLFVPFAALLLRWQAREVSLLRMVALAAAFGLIAYGNQWSYYTGTVMGILTIAGISYKLYGMLLLGGISVLELIEARLPATAFPPLVALARWRAGLQTRSQTE